MPEISDAEYRQYLSYQQLGTPTEVSRKVSDLETDNKKQRDEIRVLKENAPEDGQMLVSKGDVEELTKYRELGKLDELKTGIEVGQKAAVELAAKEVREAAVQFAATAGLAPEAVDTLTAIPALKSAKFEVRSVKNDKGDDVNVAYVTLEGENQKAMKYEDAVERVPSLKGLRTATKEDDKSGTKFGPQGGPGGEKGGQENVYAKIRKDAEDRKKAGEGHTDSATRVRKALNVAVS
jgi:hypothetical protein